MNSLLLLLLLRTLEAVSLLSHLGSTLGSSVQAEGFFMT